MTGAEPSFVSEAGGLLIYILAVGLAALVGHLLVLTFRRPRLIIEVDWPADGYGWQQPRPRKVYRSHTAAAEAARDWRERGFATRIVHLTGGST